MNDETQTVPVMGLDNLPEAKMETIPIETHEPEPPRLYSVRVEGFGRVHVLNIEAASEAEAREKALAKAGVKATVRSFPVE